MYESNSGDDETKSDWEMELEYESDWEKDLENESDSDYSWLWGTETESKKKKESESAKKKKENRVFEFTPRRPKTDSILALLQKSEKSAIETRRKIMEYIVKYLSSEVEKMCYSDYTKAVFEIVLLLMKNKLYVISTKNSLLGYKESKSK